MFLNSLSFLDEDTNAPAEGEAPIVYAYIEIYNVPSDDSVDIAFTVTTIGGSQLMQSEKRIAGSGEKLKEHFRLSSEAQAAGNFEVTIEVKHREERLVRKQRLRQTEPRQAISIEHLDDAIERMIYIATGKEIKAMLALPEGEKLDVFDAFWAKFDPSPGTPDNQYRDEYYRRIALAEREFKSYRPGWKTDRGLVLVKIGQPNYINRPYLREFDPLSRQRSQEIWEYSTLNRRVIFERVHDEYRIVNRIDIFDLLSREGIRL